MVLSLLLNTSLDFEQFVKLTWAFLRAAVSGCIVVAPYRSTGLRG